MPCNRARTHRQGGFTLIELMITVGIIGILIAVSSVSYERYQAKTPQSEAKLGLAAIYSLERSFHSEYGAFIGDLGAIGYEPEGQKRYYAIGFSAAWTGTVTGFTNPATAIPYYDRVNHPSAWVNCATVANLAGTQPAPTAVDGQTLLVVAAGQIRMGLNCDVWRMNHNKALTNIFARF
jgi:type IV pilus assembly protein PilA